jgi:flagellar biosynthetic protein FliQ
MPALRFTRTRLDRSMLAAELSRFAAEALQLVLLLSAPALAASLLAGLAVAVFQAASQLQELSLSFVPKLVAVAIALVVGGGWMGRELVRFTALVWNAIPQLVR